MYSQSFVLPIAASIMLPFMSRAAFTPHNGKHPGKLRLSPSPMRNHPRTTESKNKALHSSLVDFDLPPCSEMGSSLLSMSSLIGTDDFQGAVSHLLALNENINGALYDSKIQSILMYTLAHVMDLSTLIVPEVSLLRTASLLGRILSISADYIPDHTIASNEVVFQAPMLLISSILFAQSAFPMVVTSLSSLLPIYAAKKESSSTWKNHYAYHYLFQQVGVSLFQFRYLTSVGAIDWADVKPHDTLLGGQDETRYLYWVYRGSTELCLTDDNASITFVGNDQAARAPLEFVGFLPDMKFLCQQDKKRLKHKKDKFAAQYDNEVPSSCQYPQATIKAGPNGARVMRVDQIKLTQLMANDANLSDSIHALLVNGMELELEVLLSRAHSDVKDVAQSGLFEECQLGTM